MKSLSPFEVCPIWVECLIHNPVVEQPVLHSSLRAFCYMCDFVFVTFSQLMTLLYVFTPCLTAVCWVTLGGLLW